MTLVHLLREDHERILGELDALEALAEPASFDAAEAARLVDFIDQFVDGEHHAKEEGRLFPALRAAGLPSPGPIDVMLSDHGRARALRGVMRAALAAGDGVRFAEGARAYVTLMRDHIAKENRVLFVMAERLLGDTLSAP